MALNCSIRQEGKERKGNQYFVFCKGKERKKRGRKERTAGGEGHKLHLCVCLAGVGLKILVVVG